MNVGNPSTCIEYSESGLINAVQWGDLCYVESAIDGCGLSANTMDKDMCSLLHWASINNRLSIVEYLMHKNANLNCVGGSNMETPLQWALRSKKCAPLLKYLLAEEADMNHKSSYGCDALFIAVQCNQVTGTFLLLNAGADPNTVDNNGDTPLYWLLRKYSGAPNREYLDLLRLLIRFKATVSTVAHDGCNALHILAGYSGSNLDLASALLIYEAGDDSMCNAKNNQSKTPYEVAVAAKNSDMVRFLYDAHLFKKLPYIIPLISAAASFASLIVCLHFLGWLYGIGAYVVIFLVGESGSQSYIVRGESRAPCGMAWGIVLSAVCCYYLLFSRYFNVFVDVFGAAVSLVIFYTLYKTTTTSPHYLYGDSADSRNRLVEKIVQQELVGHEPLQLCTTCLVDRTQVSMHCSKCNRCIVSLDHHCPFVCNCVGRGNRLMFVLFALSASAGCALFTALSLTVQHRVLCAAANSPYGRYFAVQYCVLLDYPAISTLTWVTACASIWILCIFIGQMGMIASETTTYEALKHKNYGVDGLSWRGVRNVINFFCTGAYAVTSASASGAGNGAILSTESLSKQHACFSHGHVGHAHNALTCADKQNAQLATDSRPRINILSHSV